MYAAVYTKEPSQPSGGPLLGTVRLHRAILDNFGGSNLGIYNPRDVCGNLWPKWKCVGSQHARGAAADTGYPVVRPAGHHDGTRLAWWLVDHYRELGIQEVIWAGRRWTNLDRVWRTYTGRSDHFDHVHFAQTASAAVWLSDAEIAACLTPPEPDPPVKPAPQALMEDDMLVVTCPGKPMRLKDGPTCSVISAATAFRLGAKGVISCEFDPKDYDALVAHCVEAMGRDIVAAVKAST